MNKIPLLFTLNRNIYFRAVNHLVNYTVTEIVKAFKEVYQYCLHHGLCIITVNVDGEFGPLKSLVYSLPGGLLVNLAAANEHVPDI